MANRKPGIIITGQSKSIPPKFPEAIHLRYAYSDAMYDEIEAAVKKSFDNLTQYAEYEIEIMQPEIVIRYRK